MLCSVVASPPGYAQVLSTVYGTPLLDAFEPSEVELFITISERPKPVKAPRDEMRVEPVSNGHTIETDPLSCRLILDRTRPTAEFYVTQPDMAPDLLAYHFWVMINRLLLLMDRTLLHAAAIDHQGAVNVFSGRKRAGKSTLSIAFGQAGATILAEDHVVLRRAHDGFVLSGCTPRMRVTAETEHALLKGRLSIDPVDVGGTPKKEFAADQFFIAQPYIERKPDRLFLTRVKDRVSLRPASASEALLWMIDTTGEGMRFDNKEGYASFLDHLSDFVGSVDCYALELSPDISQAARVPELIAEL